MAAALAILPSVMQLITLAVPGFTHLINWVMSIRVAARQSAEWTDAMEDAFIASLVATKTNPAYIPDPPATA